MPTERELFYSNVAEEFDLLMDPYDLEQRLYIIFDRLLPENIDGKRLLDLGCGNGWFSRKAYERGASVVSLDISLDMVKQAALRGCRMAINGSALELPFLRNQFDVVVSSEMIEHTLDPIYAVTEMARVLKPGGILVLTCPNKSWQWLVDLSTRLKVRPFQGIEHFPGYNELESYIMLCHLKIQEHFGFHPWPFQIRFLNNASKIVDKHYGKSIWGRIMINQAIRASKL